MQVFEYTCILFIPLSDLKWSLLCYLTAELDSVEADLSRWCVTVNPAHRKSKSSSLYMMMKINRIHCVLQPLTSCLNDSTCCHWRGCDLWGVKNRTYFSKVPQFHASGTLLKCSSAATVMAAVCCGAAIVPQMLLVWTVVLAFWITLWEFAFCVTNDDLLFARQVSSKDEDFLDLSVDVEQNTSITHCLR